MLAGHLDRVEALHRTGHKTQPHPLAIHLHDAHLLTKRTGNGEMAKKGGVFPDEVYAYNSTTTQTVGGL